MSWDDDMILWSAILHAFVSWVQFWDLIEASQGLIPNLFRLGKQKSLGWNPQESPIITEIQFLNPVENGPKRTQKGAGAKINKGELM